MKKDAAFLERRDQLEAGLLRLGEIAGGYEDLSLVYEPDPARRRLMDKGRRWGMDLRALMAATLGRADGDSARAQGWSDLAYEGAWWL